MDGNYSFVNKHYQEKFQHIHAGLIGQPYYITMHEDDRETCSEVAAKCFANPGSSFPAVIRKHDGHGGYVATQWEYKALWDKENNPAGIFCLGYDITINLLNEKNLEEAKTSIGKTNSILKEIAFQQSHIVRRPMTNIMSLAMSLKDMEIPGEISQICDMLLESCHQLDTVIQQIVSDTHEGADAHRAL